MNTTEIPIKVVPLPRRTQVLVVDDDADVRQCIRDVLEVAGYVVACASNGKEALELLDQIEPPSLILLDLMMPIMGGLEFMRVRKESEQLGRIPVVIASAWPKEAVKADGAEAIVEKPISLDTLLRVVARWCSDDAGPELSPHP